VMSSSDSHDQYTSARALRTQTLGYQHIIPPTRSDLQKAIVRCHARGAVRDRRGKEETRGMSEPFFSLISSASRVLTQGLSHTRSAISSTLTSEGFIMVPDTRMSQFLMVNTVSSNARSFFLRRFSMKPTRIRMCHSLVMNYGLYKRMEIFVSVRGSEPRSCCPPLPWVFPTD